LNVLISKKVEILKKKISDFWQNSEGSKLEY
ncbi:hypothetical protein T11_10512, partial [Trichinella zimbabwensis]